MLVTDRNIINGLNFKKLYLRAKSITSTFKQKTALSFYLFKSYVATDGHTHVYTTLFLRQRIKQFHVVLLLEIELYFVFKNAISHINTKSKLLEPFMNSSEIVNIL